MKYALALFALFVSFGVFYTYFFRTIELPIYYQDEDYKVPGVVQVEWCVINNGYEIHCNCLEDALMRDGGYQDILDKSVYYKKGMPSPPELVEAIDYCFEL